MTYFVKGFKILNFLVSPFELENILNDFHFVIGNQRLPENYIETDSQVYFNMYKDFYNKLTSNYKFDRNNNFTNFMMGITNDLSKCRYGEIFMDKKTGKYYKLPAFNEPNVGLDLFILLFRGNDKKLFSNFSYIQYPENIFGVQMIYPKEIHYYIKENGSVKITEIKKCDEIDTYNNVYKEIELKIKRITKNFAFMFNSKEYRTNIKVSKNIKENIENIYFVKSNNLIIK